MPQPLSPADGVAISADDAILVWTESIDPEQAAVSYVVELCVEERCILSGEQSQISISMAEIVEDVVRYTWRVSATDSDGLSQGFGESRQFTVIGVRRKSE